MRVRRREAQVRVEQQMTPMIDVVFQLLVFFVMSFRIVSLEGDFNVRMPLLAQGPQINDAAPLRLSIAADDAGDVKAMRLGSVDLPPADWQELQRRVVVLAGTQHSPGAREHALSVQVACDYNLRYDHALAAVSAVSAMRTPEGQIVPLIEKVSLLPSR
jgi:biopolymer transport protein ExbD